MRYRRNYYITHSEVCRTRARNYAINNPDKVKTYLDRFNKKHPTYRRDVERIRVAVTDELIFNFLENCGDRGVDDYTSYLSTQGVSEQHIKWFRVGVQEHLLGA